jgi:hypothetical protein
MTGSTRAARVEVGKEGYVTHAAKGPITSTKAQCIKCEGLYYVLRYGRLTSTKFRASRKEINGAQLSKIGSTSCLARGQLMAIPARPTHLKT